MLYQDKGEIDMPLKINILGKYGQVFIPGAVAGLLMLASTGLAADTGRAARAIRTITPMTEVSSHRSDLNPADYFDVLGRLNLIDGNRVTIGDRELTLAPGVRTSGIDQWNLVGAMLNNAGEIVVFELVSNDPN